MDRDCLWVASTISFRILFTCGTWCLACCHRPAIRSYQILIQLYFHSQIYFLHSTAQRTNTLSTLTNSLLSTQPLQAHHLPHTKPSSNSQPDQSWPKPNWTDHIYALNSQLSGFQKELPAFFKLKCLKTNLFLEKFSTHRKLGTALCPSGEWINIINDSHFGFPQRPFSCFGFKLEMVYLF